MRIRTDGEYDWRTDLYDRDRWGHPHGPQEA